MPGRDGTGPVGQGAMTGGGFGNCILSERSYRSTRRRTNFYGRRGAFGKGGNACRGGRSRFFSSDADLYTEVHFNEKEYLENELKSIELEAVKIKERLNNLEENKGQ